MENEFQKYHPQLFMKRKNLDNLPPLQIPDGFTIRHYKDGEDKVWENIIEQAFQMKVNFKKDMKNHRFFKEERIIFVCENEKPVATATAWCYENDLEKTGYLHMVGSIPTKKGKGIGYQVSLAALHQMRIEEKKEAVLHTDDFRLPAINIYLKMGFEPIITHESHEQRWKNVLEVLIR